MDMIKIIVIIAVLGISGWIGYDWYMGNNEVKELKVDLPAPVVKENNTIYKWQDKSGVTHYTNDPDTIPEDAKTLVQNVKLPNLNEFDEKTAQNFMKTGIGSKETLAKSKIKTNDNKVTFYSVSWCPNCKKVRKLLDNNGVIYSEIDVEKNLTAAQALARITHGNNVVPVITVGKEVIIGYRPSQLQGILKKHNKIRKKEEY